VAKSLKDTRRSKTIVVAFGRFQPPTSGHQLLFNKVVETAKRMGAEHAIGFSRSQDPKKNPLSPSRKYFWLKRLFPGVNFLNSEDIRTPFDLLYYLADKGYDHVVFVGGEDRSSDYDDRVIGKLMKHSDPDKRLNLKRYDFVMAGKRDAKATGVKGMSASKMREAVANGDTKTFASGMPENAGKDDIKRLFDEIKRGMRGSMKEEIDLSELYHTAAEHLLESDKHKRRPPTPGQTGGFSKHNTQFPTPPCKIDEDLRDWFAQKWVNIGGKKDPKTGEYPPCGRKSANAKGPYPKCRPLHRVGKTPETVGEMTPKERKAAVRQKRRAEGKTPRKGKGNTPIKVSHKSLDENASCPRNPRGSAEDTWVGVKGGKVYFYIGRCSQPYQIFGNDAVSAIRYGEEIYVTLRNGKTAIYKINNGRTVFGPVRMI
jgi:hypothetical protein